MRHNFNLRAALVCALWALCLSGCSSFTDYFSNGFKVGPNYCPPAAKVSEHWIDSNDIRVQSHAADLSHWWTVFNDPVLNELTNESYQQNLPLKEAAARVLESRAQLDVATGNLFPQTQDVSGHYLHEGNPIVSNQPVFGNRWFDNWNVAGGLSWELDFWGSYRRAVIGAQAQVDYTVEDYDNTLVTLLGDIANYYTQIRVLQERIALAKANAELQRGILNITVTRYKAGSVSELDVDQAQTTLSQTESMIPQFELSMRQAENHLCTLLSVPQYDIDKRLGNKPIPSVPAQVAVGIPADLLTRRPDIRKAERACAVQSEQIGIADAQMYPHIYITGNLNYTATSFPQLFTNNAVNGTVGPTFQWNILNYGRLAANVRLQDATFQATLLAYRDTVINANEDAENGLVSFLDSQAQTKYLLDSVVAADKALAIVISQYRVGTVDFNRVATIEQTLVQQQDLYTQAKGNIAIGLIQVYRALGGGWQIRLPESTPTGPEPPSGGGLNEKPLPPLPRLDDAGINGPDNGGKNAPLPQPLPLPAPAPKP